MLIAMAMESIKQDEAEKQRQSALTHQLLRRYPVPFFVDDEQFMLSDHFYSCARWILDGAGKDPRRYRLVAVGGKTYEPGSLETIFINDFMRFKTKEIK